jgi:hypothetical protein
MFNLNKHKVIFVILILFIMVGCSKKFKHPVISNLKKSNNIIIDKNIVSFLFNSDNLKEITTFTKKNFTECNLVFTPLRKFNLNNSFSVFVNYKNNSNYIRLDIFLDNGKIHLYEKKRDKVKTYLYSKIRPFYNIHEENIYELDLKNNHLSLILNNQSIISKKISFSYGKIGVGAYGKKGDKVKFIFKSSKK